jgi:hypothetical protein
VTWTTLELARPEPRCPWEPDGASFSQTGHGAGGAVEMPSFDGASWSVLATWEDAEQARAAAPVGVDGVRSAWHVVLEPVSFRGDAVLSAGARPFAQLPPRGKVAGAAAVITLAGLGPDPPAPASSSSASRSSATRSGRRPGTARRWCRRPQTGRS